MIYDGTLPPFDALAALLAVSCALVLLATLLFKRVEPAFAKILVTTEMAADGDAPFAIDVHDLGVQYSLKFTRKTTVHRTFVNLLRRADGPSHFWRSTASRSG